MELTEKEPFSWMCVNFTHCLVDERENRIVALVYWDVPADAGPVCAFLDDPVLRELDLHEPWWFWTAVDHPGEIHHLTAPVPRDGMSDDEYIAVLARALDEARTAILDYLDGMDIA